MSVSTYNLNCGYRKLNLKSVYLIPESHLKRIHIDNGEAYIDGLDTAPYFIDADEVTLNEETSLDERYRFSKTLTFRVRGRKELDFLHERYYAIVRTEEKVNYCVNVEFPSTVSYVYNLSQDRDETTFTLRTESNHPTLRLATVISDVNVCKGYFMACVKKLKLLEKNKAALREGYTVTSSEPFKNVDFLISSIAFSEEYNGSNVSTTLTFDIPLGLYKSSWHYNLLEFIDNTYAMILEGCNGYNYAGFHFGLEPSFVITGDADNGMISLTLREMSESGGYYSQEPIPESINTATTYQFTDEHDGFVCVSAGMGQYTLQKEVNFLGNPTGNYRALEGFEDLFPDLNIVGTFTDVMLFPTDKCGGEGGGDMTGGTLPDVIELQSGQCKSFTFSAVCDWHVSNSTEDLSITPTSGVANVLYNIEVCNIIGGESKLYAVYKDGHESIIECDDSPVLSSGDTSYGGPISSITDAIIGTCVTEIGDAAFRPEPISAGEGTSYSSILSSVTLPHTITRIGNNAFQFNIQLTDINLPSGLTSIGDYAFYYCQKLTGVSIPDTVTTIGQYAFWNCAEIDRIDIPTGVTRIEESTFQGCSNLSSITIPNSVTYIGKQAFMYDKSLTELSIPSSVTTIGQAAFMYCSGLTSVVIGGGALGNSAFLLCSNLRNVTLGNVTSIGIRCFEYCSSLESIVIPDSVTTVSGMAFSNCANLTAVTFTSLVPPTFGNYIIYGSDNATIYVPCAALAAYKSALSMYESRIVGYGDDCGEESGSSRYYYKLYAEYNGGNSKTIQCDSQNYRLTSTEVNSQYPLSSMTSAIIGGCVQFIDSRAFYAYTTGYTPQTVLTSVTIASSVKEIGNEAFFGQGSIRTVSFEDGSVLTTIGNSAFANYKWVYEGGNPCYYWFTGSSLSNITFPNGLREIGAHAFTDSRLTAISLPNSLETIGTEAFSNIRTLRTVDIGTGITSIGIGCFDLSSGITSMTIRATVPPTLIPSTNTCYDGEGEPYTCYNYESTFRGNYPIYVPSGSVDTYKTAEGWSTFASRIRAIN